MSTQVRFKGRFAKKNRLDNQLKAVAAMRRGKVAKRAAERDENVHNLNDEQPKFSVEGRRIVDLEYLSEHLKCIRCKKDILLWNAVKETRMGLNSILHISCDECSAVTQVEMNSETLERINLKGVPFDHGLLLDEPNNGQETMDLLEVKDIKIEPHFAEPSCRSYEPIIKEEAEVSHQNDIPLTLPSISEEQKTFVKLEIEIKSDDPESWEDESSEYTEYVDEQPYKCSFCSKAFTRESWMKQHMNFHSGKSTYECDICGRAYVSKSALTKHIMIHIREEPHECRVCGRAFVLKSSLEKHMLNHTGKESAFTDESPTEKNSLLRGGLHNGEKPHECTVRKVHTGEKPHECTVCGKSFREKATMSKHLLIHNREKPHECNVCGRAFARKSTMQQHALIHSGEKPHKCRLCAKSFTQMSALRSHMLIHTGEKLHECNVCRKAFALKSTMKNHMLIHAGEKTHECTVCGKTFTGRSTMKRHALIHTGEKPHECSVCGKAFARKSAIKQHMLMHTGENTHKCSVCERSFVHRSAMQTHMLTHTGEGPHKCTVCRKVFVIKNALERHMLLHNGEKPQECSVCERRFADISNFKKHMLIHTRKEAGRFS